MSPCRLFRRLLSLVSHCGGDEQNRTVDPLLAKQVLSQLSYTPTFVWVLYSVPLRFRDTSTNPNCVLTGRIFACLLLKCSGNHKGFPALLPQSDKNPTLHFHIRVRTDIPADPQN